MTKRRLNIIIHTVESYLFLIYVKLNTQNFIDFPSISSAALIFFLTQVRQNRRDKEVLSFFSS